MESSEPLFDRSTEDVGNLVEFGHLNVRVPDQQTAIVFYVMGLGLTRDPYQQTGVDNAWINVGTCQFHLPVGPAQRLNGIVQLVIADIAALAARLDLVSERLRGTRFAFERRGTHVDVTCPWGNRLRVHAPDPVRFGAMLLGMPCVEVDIAPGRAPRVAAFYAQVLGARAHAGVDGEGGFARVPIGLGEGLLFRETARPAPAYDGHHIQIAVADFSGVHKRLLERVLITEESSQSQYRFQDIVDPDSGEVLLTLEHEVRSMRHPMYARVLVNRNVANAGDAHVHGHDAAMWRLPPR